MCAWRGLGNMARPGEHGAAHSPSDSDACCLAPRPILIIHGEKDDTVPLADSLDWARPRNLAVVVVPEADHFFHQRLHVLKRIIGRWMGGRPSVEWRENG